MANARIYSLDGISHQMVSDALEYVADTGILVWKEKPRNLCKSDSEYKRWNSVHRGKEAGGIGQSGYKRLKLFGLDMLLHRVIWFLHNKAWPDHEIDHVNGDKCDNRLENLRADTPSQNSRNRRLPAHNTSGVIGVAPSRSRGKWIAHIMSTTGENIYLGTFESVEMAAVARKAAEKVAGYHKNHGRRTA